MGGLRFGHRQAGPLWDHSARCGRRRGRRRLEEATLSNSDVVCTPASSFNLAAAAAAYAGLAISSAELRDQVQVYRTRPALS